MKTIHTRAAFGREMRDTMCRVCRMYSNTVWDSAVR